MKIPRKDNKFNDGSFDKKAYDTAYLRTHYDQISVKTRKELFLSDLIDIALKKSKVNKSRTEYIISAIESQLIKDGIDVDKTRETLRRMKDMQIDGE